MVARGDAVALVVRGLTDPGRMRERNEDSFGIFMPDDAAGLPVDALVVVADGVGGHSGGDVASQFVVEAVRDTFLEGEPVLDRLEAWMGELLKGAHKALLSMASSRGLESAMGSTATVVALQGARLTLTHAGDSRLYRLRNGVLTQLSEDHSWVAEQIRAGVLKDDDAEALERKNVLTQCLGIGASLTPQNATFEASEGDRYLLCSDGLHGVVDDDAIAAYLREGTPPEALAATLVEAANNAGGPDNVTAVVLDYGFVASSYVAAPVAAETPDSIAHLPAAGGSPRLVRSRLAGNGVLLAGVALLALGTGVGAWNRVAPGAPANTSTDPSAGVTAETAAEPTSPPEAVQSQPTATRPAPQPERAEPRPQADSAGPSWLDRAIAAGDSINPDSTADTAAVVAPADSTPQPGPSDSTAVPDNTTPAPAPAARSDTLDPRALSSSNPDGRTPSRPQETP